MKITNVPNSSEGASGRILLVGDVNKAFFDADTIQEELCEVSDTVPDAVNAAANNSFTAVGVVISGMSARLSSAIKVLREANLKAKIILLAQMYEEPIARQFVSPASISTCMADDYLICPVQLKTFYAVVAALQQGTMYNTSMPVTDYGRVESVLTTPVTDRRFAEVSSLNEKLERRIKQLEILSTTDDLTGLRNRRYIWEFCRQILEYAEKENGRVTLLVFDIDNFKHYNDIYGHSVGDKILKQAAVLIQRCCRTHDVVGRIGGDEFAVIFWDPSFSEQPKAVGPEAERRSKDRPGQDHPQEVIFIAKRFIKELGKAEFAAGGLGPRGEGVLTISGGLAGFPRDGSDVQELFQKADSALLEAKRSGKNRIYLVGQPQSDIADIE
jgi:GGDEF domain-containing protein